MKFRKKPVVIDAILWTGTNLVEALQFVTTGDVGKSDDRFVIKTLEGDMSAAPGDWIIRGVQGEFYPCKPDIFAATYEPVDTDQEPTP